MRTYFIDETPRLLAGDKFKHQSRSFGNDVQNSMRTLRYIAHAAHILKQFFFRDIFRTREYHPGYVTKSKRSHQYIPYPSGVMFARNNGYPARANGRNPIPDRVLHAWQLFKLRQYRTVVIDTIGCFGPPVVFAFFNEVQLISPHGTVLCRPDPVVDRIINHSLRVAVAVGPYRGMRTFLADELIILGNASIVV